MSEKYEILQRKVLRALFKSAEVTDENIRWRKYHFNANHLTRQLKLIQENAISSSLVNEIANHLALVVLRVDPLKLNVYGFERAFDRQTIAEGMGSVGVQFFPTRQSATRSAFESGREAAYFGAGSFESQFFTCPISRIMAQLDPKAKQPLPGTILRDLREDFLTNETIFDILTEDAYFKSNVHDAESFVAFQNNLRTNPLSQLFAIKCKEFFDRKATIGVRDTMRWMLGSRHPWFDWNHAQTLITSAFEKNKTTNFNTPQIVYYTYDPYIDEIEFEETQAHNAKAIEIFYNAFLNALKHEIPSATNKLQTNLRELCQWILDIHHDYPDFDLESAGSTGPSTHFDFLGHSIQNTVQQEILGVASHMRLNMNMRAHFEARGLDKKYLSSLIPNELETFFAVLQDILAWYDRLDDKNAHYKRIPCCLFLLQDRGNPEPLENERLLDTFDLSQMTQLEHASYMRSFPEISEKLVVFFALTLRHMLETDHVPDLKPRDFVKDFMILGLWGTRTPNILINLYVDKSLDERDLADKLSRCEIRFVGTEQVETHPLEHIKEEAKALRLAIAHFSPLIEPSILRNLGTFVMAMEEFRDSTHAFKIDPVSIMHYALDMMLEAARWGIKGSMTDVLTVFEYLLDNTYENIQKNIDKTAKIMEKLRNK